MDHGYDGLWRRHNPRGPRWPTQTPKSPQLLARSWIAHFNDIGGPFRRIGPGRFGLLGPHPHSARAANQGSELVLEDASCGCPTPASRLTNSMEPTRPAAANRVQDGFEALAGRLISRPLGRCLQKWEALREQGIRK